MFRLYTGISSDKLMLKINDYHLMCLIGLNRIIFIVFQPKT